MDTTLAPVSDGAAGSAPVAGAKPRRRATMIGVITFLFGAGGLAHGFNSLHDNSFLWHLRTGRLILDQHRIPHADPYSYTANGVHWIAQSWLAELLYGVLDRTVGDAYIRLAVGIATACIAVLLFRLALRTSRDRVRALAIAIPALAGTVPVWSERPLVFGLALFALLVYAVEVPDSRLGRHPRITIPVLMWLWVNVHGTFALGFVYLALHLAGRWLDGARPDRDRERDLLVGTAIAAVAIFANPYGPGLVLFPVALMSRSHVLNNVQEWQSVSFHDLTGYFYGFWLALAVVRLARSRPSRRDVLLGVVFLLLGLWAVRNLGIAILVTLPIVGRSLRREPEPAADLDAPASPVLVVLVVVVAALLIGRGVGQPTFDLSKHYPVAAMRTVEEDHLLGRHLMTTDAWAGYVIYRYWPAQHVFFDDRYDMYPLKLDSDYFEVSRLGPKWEQVLDRYKIDVVVWPKDAAVVQLLRRLPNWTEIRHDKLAAVFVRKGTT